jgi:hypothetical protein
MLNTFRNVTFNFWKHYSDHQNSSTRHVTVYTKGETYMHYTYTNEDTCCSRWREDLKDLQVPPDSDKWLNITLCTNDEHHNLRGWMDCRS